MPRHEVEGRQMPCMIWASGVRFTVLVTMAGGQGNFTDSVITDATEHIEPKEPFIDDDIKIFDTLFREFTLSPVVGLEKDGMKDTGGYDRIRGGAGNDHMFGDNH